MAMKFYRFLLIYRLQIGLGLLVLSGVLAYTKDWEWFWTCIILAFVAIGSHLFFGPIRLVQEAIQNNDMELAQKYMNTVIFPRLLFKPVRQGYYMLKSNLAMNNKDFAAAENYMKESIKSKSSIVGEEQEGASYFQLGMIAIQNGKKTEARKNLRLALIKGLPDKEFKAAALLQLAALDMQAQRISQARAYFNQAKNLKPQSPEIKEQIQQLNKVIHRVGKTNMRR